MHVRPISDPGLRLGTYLLLLAGWVTRRNKPFAVIVAKIFGDGGRFNEY